MLRIQCQWLRQDVRRDGKVAASVGCTKYEASGLRGKHHQLDAHEAREMSLARLDTTQIGQVASVGCTIFWMHTKLWWWPQLDAQQVKQVASLECTIH